MSTQASFDPYALLEELERERVSYVVVGAFARVVHGSAESTNGVDIVPSLRDENVRRLARSLDALDASEPGLTEQIASSAPVTIDTRAGELRIVPEPWGTRGYDELRRRAVRENLGRGVRPSIASLVDCARMLEASAHDRDAERLHRLRRLMELERHHLRQRRLTLDR